MFPGHRSLASIILIGGRIYFRVLPFLIILFQMSDKSHDEYDYDHHGHDHSVDNLDELEDQGWREGHPCYIYVDAEGDLGQCVTFSDATHMLIGSGVSLLLLLTIGYILNRIYRCNYKVVIFPFCFPLSLQI